ncbi:MAG: VOC family protein [Bacteroidota bacterium]
MSTPTLSALFFYVRDLDRTAAFYGDVLGFHVERAEGHDGAYLIASAGEDQPAFVFYPADEPPGRSPVVVFGLEGGIEEAVAALVRHNVEIVTPVSEAPDGGLTADFLDPDGHVLSYYQPVEQA